MKKRLISKILASVLLAQISLGSFSAAAEQHQEATNDLTGHWSESTFTNWAEKGYVKGYEDGSYRPEAPITRAEFAALVNRTFGFRTAADPAYRDVAKEDWFHEPLARAAAAGYLSGYEDGTAKPNQSISRQEAAVILSRLLPTRGNIAEPDYLDRDLLPSWAVAGVANVGALGIMNGYPDQTFQGERPVTRAESIVALNKALEVWGYTYKKSGTYGYDNPNQTIDHKVTIDAASVTLENMTILGDLTISKKVGDGDVALNHVTVKGDVHVFGGGERSVHLQNAVLGNVIVDRPDGQVRIVSESGTKVSSIRLLSAAILEQSGDTGAGNGFGAVYLPKGMPAGSHVSLIGNFREVRIGAPGIQVDLTNGSAGILSVEAGAGQTTVLTGESTGIAELQLDEAVNVKGQGRIEKAVMNEGAKGSTFETKPGKSEGAGAAQPQQPGAVPPGGVIPPAPGGSGSKGGSSGGGGNSGGNNNGGSGSTNQAPTGSLEDAFFIKGSGYPTSWRLKLTDSFSDPDGDPISFGGVRSSDPSVMTAALDGGNLIMRSAGVGSTEISVSYSDGRGGTGTAVFKATIVEKFSIDSAYGLDSHRLLVKFDKAPSAGAFSRMDVQVIRWGTPVDKNVFAGYMVREEDDLGKFQLDSSDRQRSAIFMTTEELEQETYDFQFQFYASDGNVFSDEKGFQGKVGIYPLVLLKSRALTNTSIELTFNDILDMSTIQTSSFRLINRQTGQSVAIDDFTLIGSVISLTVPPLELGEYQIKVSGIKSSTGFTISSFDDWNESVFRSLPAGQPITSVTAFVYSPNELTLTFDQPVGPSATDINHYEISEIGKPITAKIGPNPNQVVLTIPDLSDGLIYSLQVYELETDLGILYRDTIIASFTSSSNPMDPKPGLINILASNTQTVRLFFDRPVSYGGAWDLIWNGDSETGIGTLLPGVFRYSDAAGEHDFAGGKAAIDYSNPYALDVRMPMSGAFYSGKAINRTFFSGTANTSVVRVPSSSGINFQASDWSIYDIEVSSVIALDTNTIRVFFNQPVTTARPSFAHLSTDPDGQQGIIELVSGTRVDAGVYDFKLASWLDGSKILYYLYVDGGPDSVQSPLGFVSLKAEGTNRYKFFSVSHLNTSITATPIALDKRSIKIFYSEAMNPEQVTRADAYTFFDYNDNPVNLDVRDVAYDEKEKEYTVTITIGSSLEAGKIYKIGIARLPNAAGNKFIEENYTRMFAGTNTPVPCLSVGS